MGYIASTVTGLSAHVVANLAAGGYPALVDGGIVVGTAAEFEQTRPPRIIFDPTPGSKYGATEWYSASTTLNTTERELQIAQREVCGDNLSFFVHCWGAASTGVVVDDYDITRALAHAVRAALQHVVPGAFQIEDSGKFRTGTNIIRLGRWYTMGVTLYTPVLESLEAYDRDVAYAPDGVTADGDDMMLIPTTGPQSGPSEAGCT